MSNVERLALKRAMERAWARAVRLQVLIDRVTGLVPVEPR